MKGLNSFPKSTREWVNLSAKFSKLFRVKKVGRINFQITNKQARVHSKDNKLIIIHDHRLHKHVRSLTMGVQNLSIVFRS